MKEIQVFIECTARFIEVAGITAIIIGIAIALIKYAFGLQKQQIRSYKTLRQELGKAILLGLEILVAGDIIATVVTEPTMQRVLVLGVIVLIRTFLSFSIQLEIEGRFPWQKSAEVPNE